MKTLGFPSAFRILRGLGGCALLLLLILRVDTAAAATLSAPASSTNGTYTVSFSGCSIYCMLEEKVGASGTFAYVAGAYGPIASGPGYGQYDASGKPPGVYYYRVGDLITDFYTYGYYVYSNEITVIVAGTPAPAADTVATQAGYTYETRRGDIDGDGLLDLLVRRTVGGVSGNGTLETVILQRLSSGGFTQFAPSSSQLSTALGWAAIAVDLNLSDFNLDGYIDVFLNNLGDYFSGATGQVVVSWGQALVQGAQALVPMDAKYTKFANEVGNWAENPNWYTANAPVYQVPVYQLVPYCYYWYDEIGQLQYYCEYYYVFVGYAYVADYSGFDQDGIALANAFHGGSPDLPPGSADGKSVDATFRRVFGVPLLRGVLDTGCSGGVLSYDGEDQVTCSPNHMGLILLANITTYTERGIWRYLTAGEKATAVAEGLQIRGVDKVRVYNRGYSIFNLASQVMSPNGNIYIGTENVLAMPWSEDYSTGPISWLSVMTHEMTHSFQVRTRGCITVCMYLRALGARLGSGYVYTPMDPNKGYYSHNIEQQAEMVQDRFLLKHGQAPWGGINQSITLPELNAKIPF